MQLTFASQEGPEIPHSSHFRIIQWKIICNKRALIRRIGLFLYRGWAQHIVNRWRDVASPVPRPLLQTTSIFFLAISSLISRSAALTAALMCLVQKHLAQWMPLFSFCSVNSLLPLALPRAGVGEKKNRIIHDYIIRGDSTSISLMTGISKRIQKYQDSGLN